MDSEIKFRVINSDSITNFGIIVELENVENGIQENGVLKSINSNLFWEVQNRIIENSIEKTFENENIIYSHLNKVDYKLQNDNILIDRENKNIRLYKIKSIGNNEKPIVGEDLVFHSTTFRQKIQVKEIYEDYVLLENKEGYFGVIPKRKIPKWVEVVDYVRHCEHQFHDLVDENDNFIYRH
ncbi:hypothetical protein [Flavobacterium sp. GCM10027622]|uniref:hypothetical protein n=1 Tax=unclassified Flavobacterium TaxID=196869 RepID=UPI0036148BAE